ncbi:hypothetical protein, partial [Streptomyces lavendulae]|uniref:hypothetical protein n=1 Tax=Streptomyces lavendulae TaxID=1914 RepID=UPI0031EB4B7C
EYHYQTIVINCTNPDLTANTLNVTNASNLNTLTNTGQINANAGIVSDGRIYARAGIQGDGTNPLRVHQPAGLQVDAALDAGGSGGHPAKFHGQVTVDGATSLNGNTNAKSLTVNGNLTVDPGSAGYAWIKSGRLDVNSAANFNAYGPVSLFKKDNRQLLWDQNILTNFGTKTYRADGDGLLTARVWSGRWDSNVVAPELDSYFTVFATSASVSQAATVAQSIRQGSPIPYSSFCLPVAKGNTVTVQLANSRPSGAGGENGGRLWLFWTPLGGGPNLVQVATSTQAEEQEFIPVSDEGGDEHEDSIET